MKPIGVVFRPKTSFEALREELVPSFDSVLEAWLSGIRRTALADPNYVVEITYVTPPLKAFIERIAERLNTFGIIGGPLERGFGFGKTHSLIFLWHLFTSNVYRKVGLNITDKIVRETLVLGMDCSKDKPLIRLVEELEAYTNPDHPVTRVKDPTLLQAISIVLKQYSKHELYSISSEKLAELIAQVLEKYEELGGRPRLLLLVDELGWGLAQRLRRYAERMSEGKRLEADAIYAEANAIANFLSYLYDRLHGKAVAAVVIWVLAEQDRREINILAAKHQDNEILYSKIKGLLDDLDNIAERYSRGLGGTSLAELSYSPEHALEIARYRILKTVEGVELSKLQEEYVAWIGSLAKQLNPEDVVVRYKEDLKRYYPFSLGLINLLKKLMNPRDAPATEFVRTVIHVASEATRKALHTDPEGSYTIGVKHLSIPETVQAKLMGVFETDWVQAASDIEDALSKIEPEKRKAAELAAKYILAKGVTANIIAALESRDRRDVERYGSTLDELQIELIETFTESEAFQLIEVLNEALERLRAESARIDEREVEGKRYYLPSFFRTIYNKLTSYIIEERRNLENKAFIPIYIKQTGTIPSLFVNVRVTLDGRSGDAVATLMEYRKVKDVDALISDPEFQDAQSKGKLLLILVPPWDMDLFNEMYISGRNYEDVMTSIVKRLQNAVESGKIRRHLHVVVLVPDLAPYKLDRVLDKLVVYEGTKKFLDYLSRKEDVINERLQEFESTLVKRKDLLSILSEEVRRRHLRELRSKLERDIAEAKSVAQKQLVRLSRELVVDVLELYHKVAYFSLDKNMFTVKDIATSDVVKLPSDTSVQYIAIPRLSEYASIVNKFLTELVRRLAYEYDVMKIMRAVLEAYKKEFKRGIVRESDRVDEILENILLGTYGVKPLSADVAREAIRYLDGQTIELDDKFVKIVVDEPSRLIRFEVRIKESKPEITMVGAEQAEVVPVTSEVVARPTTAEVPKPERVLQLIHLELPPKFNVDDIRSRLVALMKMMDELKAKVSSIELRLDTANISLNLTLKEPGKEVLEDPGVKAIMNIASRISDREGRTVYIDIRLSEPIAEDNVRKVFGEYFKTMRSSFDKFLPT